MLIMSSASSKSAPARRVGRPPGPTAHGAASRDRILDAAATVFARLGYDRARMADIVSQSGLTRGSVYFHFESKEALAIAVLSAKHAQWLNLVRTRLAATPQGARLDALLPTMLELHRDDPDAWVMSRLIQNMADVPETRPLTAQLMRTWIDLVADLIRDTQRATADTAVEIDPTLLATILVGAFDGMKNTVSILNADTGEANAQLAAGGRVLLVMLRSLLRPA
jgi:AcrR family transcriptional regulator